MELPSAQKPPASWPGLSPCHLSPEQVRFFDDNGYLVLKHWITGELLERMQRAGQAWMEQGKDVDESDPRNEDYKFASRPGGRIMYSVDYVHNKSQPASLELLGSPKVLGVAESLCGPNLVPTYESMVFKQKGNGAEVRWHQDAVHPRKYRVFNYDLYLDRSRKDAGCLRVLPGTHRAKQDVCNLVSKGPWDREGIVPVEMEPGDVLLHDVMIVHGSPRTEGKDLRRTIYYEFRPAEQILEEGPWDAAWIDKRLRLLPLGLKRHGQAFPSDPQFEWNISPRFKPQAGGSEEEELRIAHIVHTPGSFCSAGDSTGFFA